MPNTHYSFFRSFDRLRRRRGWRVDIREWTRRGRALPPPHAVKESMLYEHAKRFGLTTLVETGTYKGAMVAAMRPFFEDIISVELSEPLYADAARRFADDSRISIMQGDSATVLPRVLSSLQAGALFWLDAHCSGGETAGVPSSPPVDDELRLIVRHRPDHVVLIDDTHYLGETAQAVAARFGVIAPPPRWRVSVKDDVVRVLPAQPT